MLSREENQFITPVGLGTLIRRYWIPATYSNPITKYDSRRVRVRLLGENLVAFRDCCGRPDLLDKRCRYRTASLF